jgi:uncharacterized protein (DUF305 family)
VIDVSIRNSRWRRVSAVAIMVATVLAVVSIRSIGNAQAPADGQEGALGVTDAAFVQMMISMDDRALALYVLLQADSATLAGVAGQLAESHRAELLDLRVVLASGSITEDNGFDQSHDVPGLITGDDLVAVHQAAAADRDALAIELIYQHLTQGVLLADGEQQSGRTPAAKELASRVKQSRASQLALLVKLPTTAPA